MSVARPSPIDSTSDAGARAKEMELATPTAQKSKLASAPLDDDGDDPQSMYEEDEADSDEAEFEDASEDLKAAAESGNDTAPDSATDGATKIKLDKKEIKSLLADAEKNVLVDIAEVEYAVDMFLNSRFVEPERYLKQKYCRSMYYTLGYAVILWLKSVMTFDPADVEGATDALRNTLEMATLFRKEQGLVASFTGMVMRAKEGSHLKNMTTLQRHAELVYAEAHLLKSMLSLVTDTNMVAFVREGLNIRSAYNVYKSCYRFLQRVYDEEGGAQGLVKNGVDEHFVSGVLLGVGGFNVTLSMLPGKVLRLFELIGFSGDRDFGLSRLEIGGKWPVNDRTAIISRGKSHKPGKGNSGAKGLHSREDSLPAGSDINRVPFAMPETNSKTGGLRKFLCDLVLLGYHIILSSAVQLPDCDIPFAKEILSVSLKKYPDSFIFLALHGRLFQTEGKPSAAIAEYKRVMNLQSDWRQLVHVCVWDSGICNGALGDWTEAANCYEVLFKESRWSKAIYRYMQAVYLYAIDEEKNRDTVAAMLKEVPKLTQKIAGKSIPMEKFVSRKSRKFALQNNRLLLPHFEILYLWNGFDVIPQEMLSKFLDRLDIALKGLEAQLEKSNSSSNNEEEVLPYDTFYDDLCLARFLKGVLTRETAIPNSETLLPVTELAKQPRPSQSTIQTLNYASRQLEFVVHHADKIKLDHWVLPFARLELGKLYARSGEYGKARREFGAALNGGFAEDEVGEGMKRPSLENTLHFRVHNAIVKLDVLEKLVGERP
ncbi:uncharacterized protein SPPG_00166 [Spizellomyces punctatus DAOM BR117]|uniref:Tetratricopeptide repeat protein 39B n=1 Tax=Spizellomyces punctatus (strain DAOM BR117) TaxID=645134 RepID=A0A0L0HTL3_SPIPD|nr:uncharacterized protein SPPG_00166 [Spizellomyces punctatus DAOM BR117]KND04437.1 hypothetical protein SPPG_00166 [Spizellomyces punctatus DAOM BR117]|eukprot:XP_016612476.1 hypothetical protein SPPG_00166 [Spizellomyces punctatus DAOM BR117]